MAVKNIWVKNIVYGEKVQNLVGGEILENLEYLTKEVSLWNSSLFSCHTVKNYETDVI